ncbi:MAG: putative Ig domain-containing protein, partial [Thermoplasmata archaeon]|nr:putative Ig domain-containing protein [Thermoplasmata archaeon]
NTSSNNHFWRSRIIANSLWGIYFNQQANDNIFLGIGSADFQGSNIAIVMKNNSVNASFINSTVGSSNVLPLWIDQNSSIIFLNSVLNENTVAILDSLSTMTMMYYLTVKTVNKTNVPIPNASVEVYDNKTKLIAANDTNPVGELPLIPCISYIRNQTVRDYSRNNHILIANDSISTKTAYVNMSFTKVYVFKFNYIPTILTADNLTAIEKVFYSVKYEAISLELEKNVTWSLKTNTSSWLQLDAANGTIYGTPHNRDVGQPWVRVIARDMDGDTAESLFTLTIQNTAPEIITTNQLTAFEDDYYYVNYNSTDDDGYLNETGVLIFPENNLTTWQGKPNADWLQFDNESGILNGTPSNNHVGRYNVQIFVDDGHGGKSSSVFTLTVINTPPKIISPDVTVAYKNVNYYNDYNSSDDGQGVITWKMETNTNKNRTWLYLNEKNGTLNGTPRQANVGTWWVNITVIDDHGGKTSHNFTLTVIDLNEPPKIKTENVLSAYTNKLYSVQYEADDPDTPLYNLSWAVNTNATWLEIDPETGVLSGTPQKWHVGWYWVNVSVMDNEGGAGFTEFIINVTLLPNTPPSLVESSLIPDNEATIEAFHSWKHTFKAEDDYTPANELNWSLATNAVWLTINK